MSFQIDGRERLRWHFGLNYPRPFFYPLISPAGHPLTRMGHPGAPNHDHHRSVWFAHHKVGDEAHNFWGDNSETRIRQRHWLAYEDTDDEALMAVELDWLVGHEEEKLCTQRVVAAVRPGAGKGETELELQSTLTPTAQALTFDKTNFGFLAVRVARSVSEHFGGGTLTNSAGAEHERNIFGKPAAWMDYSGPTAPDVVEGVTYFDHPSNPGYPNKWHVREDGWMGCSPCMDGPLQTTRDKPLTLRFLLHAHAGQADAARAQRAAKSFADRPALVVSKATVKHRQFVVRRGA